MEKTYWLLSTIAQSSAAIVAIIGGFVLNKIIQLSSSKNGINSRLIEIEGMSNEKFSIYRDLCSQKDELEIKDLLYSKLNELIENRGEISLVNIMKKVPFKEHTIDDMQKYYDKIKNTVQEAFKNLKSDTKPFADYIVLNNISLHPEDWFVYERVYYFLNNGVGLKEKYSGLRKNRDYNKLTDEWKEVLGDIRLLKTQKIILQNQLANIGNINLPKSSVFIFAFFTLVGVLAPIILIHAKIKIFDSWIVLAFVVGVISIFGFLYFIIRKIK